MGMKVLVMTLPARVRRYYDITSLPEGWSLVFAGHEGDIEALVEMGGDADAIFADAMQPVPAALIRRMPNLKLVHSEGVGYDRIDLAAAAAQGVYVCNNAAANAKAVAEQAVMLMLASLRRTVEGHRMVMAARQDEAKGKWSIEGIRELWSCRVGLIGMGAIAKQTAKRLLGFGCAVSYYSRTRLDAAEEAALGVSYLPLEALLGCCDILSLHLPLNDQTRHFMNAEKFSLIKRGAILINTARGEVVDQDALIDALIQGRLGGAGLDTVTPEPVRKDNTIINLPEDICDKVTLAPHIGGVTEQAFYTMHRFVWENMLRVAQGERPRNIVNGL
jgi:lactate dehydrogenase-like 2-hydroxyacid dehydrogenase